MIFLLSSFQHFIRLRNITHPKTGFYSWKIKLLTQITYGINFAFGIISLAIFYSNKKLVEKNPEENKDDGHIFAKTALNKVSQTLLRFVVIFWNLHHWEKSFLFILAGEICYKTPCFYYGIIKYLSMKLFQIHYSILLQTIYSFIKNLLIILGQSIFNR